MSKITMQFKKSYFIFILALSMIFGSSYNLFLSYDYKTNPDCQTYLNIANGNFSNQSLVRKYRIIVPFCAKVISLPIQGLYYKLWPQRDINDVGPLRIGFLIVNSILMGLVGLVIYNICIAYQINQFISILVMLMVLIGGRWGSILAALPITDSFYMLIISLCLLSVKTKNHLLIIPCLVFGVLSKEAFLMMIPYVLYLSTYSKYKLIGFILLGIAISWATRYYIDLISLNNDISLSIKEDVNHFYNIKDSIVRIFSIRGVGELCTTLGFFTLIPLMNFINGKYQIVMSKCDKYIWLLIPVALCHALLSTEIGRMLYLFSAPIAVITGLTIIHSKQFIELQKMPINE